MLPPSPRDMDTFTALLAGAPHFKTRIQGAVAARFQAIQHRLVQGPEIGVAYDGNRCLPKNLGWRFAQSHGEPDSTEILAGKWDAEIEDTWHKAARAEHWYRHEKDWGN